MRHIFFLALAALALALPAAAQTQRTTSGEALSYTYTDPLTLDALNEAAVIAIRGRPFVGISVLGAATADLSLVVEFSTDNGGNWDERFFWNGDKCIGIDNLPHPVENVRNYGLYANTADTHARVRVAGYTSGSVSAWLQAGATVNMEAVTPACRSIAVEALLDGVDTLNLLSNLTSTVGFFLHDSTLDGTLTVEGNADTHRNTDWKSVVFHADNAWRVGSWVVTAATASSAIIPLSYPPYQRYRLRVSVYNSGASRAVGHGSPLVNDPIPLLLTATNTITNVASGTADADAAVAAATFLRLCGFAIKESAGTPAAAVLSLVHGATVAGGTQINGWEFDLAANGQLTQWLGPDCIAVPNGISVDRVSGTTKLTLLTKIIP